MVKSKRFRIIEKDAYKISLLMDNDEVLLEISNNNGFVYEDIENICNILNKLNDENEELKQDYNSLRRTAYQIDEIAHADREYAERLYRQNQQLEEELQYCKTKCGSLEEGLLKLRHKHSNLHDMCCDLECEKNSLKKDVKSLKKENERLKYDRNNCRKQQIRQAKKIHELFEKNGPLRQQLTDKEVEWLRNNKVVKCCYNKEVNEDDRK